VTAALADRRAADDAIVQRAGASLRLCRTPPIGVPNIHEE
jgi:hypothetical protein